MIFPPDSTLITNKGTCVTKTGSRLKSQALVEVLGIKFWSTKSQHFFTDLHFWPIFSTLNKSNILEIFKMSDISPKVFFPQSDPFVRKVVSWTKTWSKQFLKRRSHFESPTFWRSIIFAKFQQFHIKTDFFPPLFFFTVLGTWTMLEYHRFRPSRFFERFWSDGQFNQFSTLN